MGLAVRTDVPRNYTAAPPKTFGALIGAIVEVHGRLATQATKAVNACLTLRNWLIGYYIREYELGGKDRASYGEHLLERLACRLREQGLRRADERELRRYRQLSIVYPQIRESLSPELEKRLFAASSRGCQQERPASEIRLPGPMIVENLSFSHLADNRLFVSRYQVALPTREDIRRFLEEQIRQRLPQVQGGETRERGTGHEQRR